MSASISGSAKTGVPIKLSDEMKSIGRRQRPDSMSSYGYVSGREFMIASTSVM